MSRQKNRPRASMSSDEQAASQPGSTRLPPPVARRWQIWLSGAAVLAWLLFLGYLAIAYAG